MIGQIASALMATWYMKKFKRVVIKLSYFRLSLYQIKKTITMGMSNGLTQLAITLVQVVMNRSLIHYGNLSIYGSDIPLAASGIVMKVNSIVFAVLIGITQGVQPILGFNYGAKLYDRVKKTYKLAIVCVVSVGAVALFVFQVFPERVLMIFGKENELYMEFAVRFMRTFLLMLPLSGVHMISSNLFAAIGKPVRGAMLSLTRQVFFLIPLMLILPLFFGIKGVLMAAPSADFLAFLVVLIFVSKEMRGMKE